MQLRFAIAAALALAARPAAAHPYETFIDVDDEEDLYDLQLAGDIGEDTRDALVELMQDGVDLDRAGREELYSLPNLTYADVDAILDYRRLSGSIRDPIDLVAAGVLSQQKLEAIAGFLIVVEPTRARFATSGSIRGQARWTASDEDAPPAALQMRATTLQNLTVGAATVLTRNRLADVRVAEGGDDLSAVEAGERVVFPKFYARWETDRWGIIAGTYRIGFGQRLTFDNTSHYTPNGFYRDDQLVRATGLVRQCRKSAADSGDMSPCADEAGDIFETPDYTWREGLLGVAAGLKRLEVGSGHVQSYVFGSYRPRSIYQYEIFNADSCDDPHDENCDAPRVLARDDAAARYSFSTLPDLYTEMLAGGNIAYAASRRSHIGLTGYGADVTFAPDGMALDFQEYSRLPYGGPFGAVGVDGSLGLGMFDFFGEVARSFDSMPEGEGGGFGGLVRSVATFEKENELEASLRYYDENFKNPYARAIAAPDELEGARARDEMGARLRYSARISRRLGLRASADVWTAPSDDNTDAQLDGRADVDLTDQIGLGLSGRYARCLEPATPLEDEESGDAELCLADRYTLTGSIRYAPAPHYSLVAQYRHEVVTDEDRQDASATLIAAARPSDWLRLRGRVRYLYEDITRDEVDLEESIWGYVDVGIRPRPRDWLRLRYDAYVYFDERESTLERVPSPEHGLWLEYEARF